MFNKLKWAVQRVFRGWDDRVIWNIDMYLARMMPVWLRQLKAQKGFPPLVFHGDDVDIEESEKMWNEILDKMIEGFEAAQHIDDLPAWEELRKVEQERFGRELLVWNDKDELDELYTELDFWRKYQEQYDEALATFKEGMALFTEHFFSLWD